MHVDRNWFIRFSVSRRSVQYCAYGELERQTSVSVGHPRHRHDYVSWVITNPDQGTAQTTSMLRMPGSLNAPAEFRRHPRLSPQILRHYQSGNHLMRAFILQLERLPFWKFARLVRQFNSITNHDGHAVTLRTHPLGVV